MKNIWKFILPLVLAAAMLFSFCACAKKDVEEAQTETDEVTEEGSSPTDSGGSDETPPTGGNEGGPSEGDGGESNPLDNLTLMSFNIRYYNTNDKNARAWDNRKQAIGAFINASGASVVCMQEVKPEQKEYFDDAISDKYGMIWYGREATGGEGLAIAYDKGVWELKAEDRFWLSPTPDEPSTGWGASIKRICVTARLMHKSTGAMLDVYNVHLDHQSKSAQENGIALVLERIAESPYPVYMCGDFNCYSTDTAYKSAAAVMNDCMVTSPVTDNGVTYQNWGAITEGTPIDFIFFSKEQFDTLTFEICRDKWGADNENYLSDHFAIKATVNLKCVTEIPENPDIPEPVEPLPDLGEASGTNGEDGDYTQNY